MLASSAKKNKKKQKRINVRPKEKRNFIAPMIQNDEILMIFQHLYKQNCDNFEII